MAKSESDFQKELIDEIKKEFPGAIAIKNDAGYIQGFPDWTILYKNKWAVLEVKQSRRATKRPNQDLYVEVLDSMSYSSFVYPENKEVVLRELHQAFQS